MSNDEPDVADPCAECGGKCCSFRSLTIAYRRLEPGERYDSMLLDGDHIDGLIFTDGTVPDMDWYTIKPNNGLRALVFECNHLTDDGKCGAYNRRPNMCREFECPALTGDEDLDDWLASVEPEYDPEELIDREVTDRVKEIIARDATVPDDVVAIGGAN